MEWQFSIHGHTIRIFLDSERVTRSSGLDARCARTEACLNLLPPEHLRLIVEPIIVVDHFPGGRHQGGGWFPPTSVGDNASVAAWLEQRGSQRTGVAPEQILSRVGGAGGTGIIGITTAAFLRDDLWAGHHAHEFTLLHEIGHSVDFHSSLIPPRDLPGRNGNAPYQGQRYPGGKLSELAAEAYSRFFLKPNGMCRGGKGTPPCVRPDGSPATAGLFCPTQRQCSARLQRDLQNTPAFRMTNVVFLLAGGDTSMHLTPRRDASHARERRGPFISDEDEALYRPFGWDWGYHCTELGRYRRGQAGIGR